MPLDGKAEIHVIEKYTNLEDLDEHRKTAHYLRLREQISAALAEPPSTVTLEPVLPGPFNVGLQELNN